ncbi:MAG: ferritin [Bryobacteraceae bacterium]|nr:ferritin-like domain-containing protein [Bryobacterales bacterium]MEB2360525.1 ferritin-like domain-containing protein [Bryobacterales bacterium]NUN00371.1 ferritin [Bryobacteraceae bacterium]
MSTAYHEPTNELTGKTRDLHRALASLQEELEAIDWYQQRIDVAADAELKAILAHNRDEEVEHATMVLEWIRRRYPVFDQNLREYLFTSKPILEIEDESTGGGSSVGSGNSGRGLGIGNLHKEDK